MKQQLLQSRENLINHLQSKIQELKKRRHELLSNQNQKNQVDLSSHVNLEAYLKKQGVSVQKSTIVHIHEPKQPNFEDKQQITFKSKADLLREQKETKSKLEVLKDVYQKKRQLESIGIYEQNPHKIKDMYLNGATKKSIDRKIMKSKKQKESKIEKDKIIEEQMKRVEKFLQESKKSKKSSKVPENHYSQLISDKEHLKQYESLLYKKHLTLVDKENLLDFTFSLLKASMNHLDKPTLKIFLLSNIEFCSIFNITKNEIMRDLEVHQTAAEGVLTYEQFYELIKSIQITNKALYPNLNFKINENDPKPAPVKKQKKQRDRQFQLQKEMEKYLQSLFVYFDKKSQKIIQRQRFQIGLKKALLYDGKKYKAINKNQIIAFGERITKRRQNAEKSNYYKSLEMKYIGLEEIISEFRQYRAHPQIGCQKIQGRKMQQNTQILQPQLQFQAQAQRSISSENQHSKQPLPAQALQEQDFKKYGWDESDVQSEQFQQLKQMDKYYGQIRNKYGNQISWNGFQRYREDFSKFNQCIKQMNENHTLKSNN